MDHFPGNWGRPSTRDAHILTSPDYFPGRYPAGMAVKPNEPVAHTRSPIVTGTSVLGLKYKDGVMLIADNLGKSSG